MRVLTESYIDGDFEGMDFDRVFVLDNGQEWQQVANRYHYHYSYRPRVRVLEDGGRYYIEVQGFSERIEVRRH